MSLIINNQKVHEIALLAQQCGFLDEQQYLYYCIYEDYEMLHKAGKKVEVIDAELAEKYCKSKSRIHRVYYEYKSKVESNS